jgi:nucleoside-diphosphate-sugar epimerase
MRILIIGGTGSFSVRVTESAVSRGHNVVLYNRGQRRVPDGLRVIEGERSELRRHAEEISAFDPEVVVDSICFKPQEAEDLVSLFPDIRRLIMISSVDVYGEDESFVPITETQEPRPVSEYGKNKLACEQLLLQTFGRRVTIFRPSHILGRRFVTASLWSRSPYLVDRIRKGKAIPTLDGGRNLSTPVYSGDIAEWIMRALEKPETGGEVFNAVGGHTITKKRYFEIIAEILGVELRLVSVPSALFYGLFPKIPQYNWHRIYSCAKVSDAMGLPPQFTPEMMLRETVEFMLENTLVKDCSEDPFDDELVEMLLRHEAEVKEKLEQKVLP